MLERFTSIAPQVASPAAALEAVRDGDRLIFRQGAQDARFWRAFLAAFVLVLATLAVLAIYHSLPISWSWLPISLILFAAVWLLLQVPKVLAQRSYFVIHSTEQAITVYPLMGPASEVPLDHINCFVCGWVPADSGVNAKLYAIGEDDTVYELAPGLDDHETVKKQTALLGYISEKQAFVLDQDTWIRDLLQGGPDALEMKVNKHRLRGSSTELRYPQAV